jgi:hypothetical protein
VAQAAHLPDAIEWKDGAEKIVLDTQKALKQRPWVAHNPLFRPFRENRSGPDGPAPSGG